MDDFWKFVLYALAVGVYYFIKGRKKTDDPANANRQKQDAAKPFMSPVAQAGQPDKRPSVANTLEDLLRQYTQETPSETQRPEPMLEDKVRKQNSSKRKKKPQPDGRFPEGRSLNERLVERSLETGGYDQQLPRYRNEASDVDYEVPEKAGYQGLNDNKDRFEVFEKKQEVPNRFAQLLRNPESARDAFVLGEIFRRKEF